MDSQMVIIPGPWQLFDVACSDTVYFCIIGHFNATSHRAHIKMFLTGEWASLRPVYCL